MWIVAVTAVGVQIGHGPVVDSTTVRIVPLGGHWGVGSGSVANEVTVGSPFVKLVGGAIPVIIGLVQLMSFRADGHHFPIVAMAAFTLIAIGDEVGKWGTFIQYFFHVTDEIEVGFGLHIVPDVGHGIPARFPIDQQPGFDDPPVGIYFVFIKEIFDQNGSNGEFEDLVFPEGCCCPLRYPDIAAFVGVVGEERRIKVVGQHPVVGLEIFYFPFEKLVLGKALKRFLGNVKPDTFGYWLLTFHQ